LIQENHRLDKDLDRLTKENSHLFDDLNDANSKVH